MRQYFDGPLADSLITPQAAIAPGVVQTSLLTVAQANKYLPLPYGQNAPSPGSVFKIRMGGICTTVSGNVYFIVYHGPGTTPTAFGTPIAVGPACVTPVAASGSWLIEGTLVYRSISEVTGQSVCWFNGFITINPISSPLVAAVHAILQSLPTQGVVDTTGNGAAGSFGALNISVIDNNPGSTWTTDFAFSESVN